MNTPGTCRTLLLCLLFALPFPALAQPGIRTDILLNGGWHTAANDSDQHAFPAFESLRFNDAGWKRVDVPHNWDQYEGYRRLKHGNRHGYAWYRKTFTVARRGAGKQYFLWFEGVGSYATVWLNGQPVGSHKGGRTSFSLNITDAICFDGPNLVAVRADHPAMIADLPWVCGGCSDDRGFSEGTQPMGIFRPVHLVVTGPVRIAPFGVHIWNDVLKEGAPAALHLETTLKNYTGQQSTVKITSKLLDKGGRTVALVTSGIVLPAGHDTTVRQPDFSVQHPQLWSLEHPDLYKVVTEISSGNKVTDRLETLFGIRWISWPIEQNKATGTQFFLNGKPVFINGTAEYEHLMGRSHAFTPAEVRATVMQVKAAGFNAFRDAHQPHNLLFQEYWDRLGLLWWPQFSAHDWYDTPGFRANFKQLLREWVIERRNNPSNVLWGLQNESKLPEAFARECTDMIRALDPTASSQRKVTTCNGGTGTDWNVPQNWTGTYGGDPLLYADDLRRQLLIGEYGAWRSLGLHTEGNFKQNGPLSEDRMAALMETKIRLAESVRDASCGQFHWLMGSHENPGRIQGGEGFRELDRVGPVNYKGLFTPWGEPTDAYFMFRANYAPAATEPMVYLVSHTWPYRWNGPGLKDSIVVYSNCEEVELFNDRGKTSLGKRKRKGIGTHFQWDGVPVQYGMLYVEGRVGGQVVARDFVVQPNLPPAPHGPVWSTREQDITRGVPGYRYLYRVNCGGPDWKDPQGNTWMADRRQADAKTWGSRSWTNEFREMTDFFASQRSNEAGEEINPLFQTVRYGMDKLQYAFPLPDGDYLAELFFTEPWYGANVCHDCSGWRLFDVALNGRVVEKDLDIWKQAGQHHPLKKTYPVHVTGGRLVVSFPSASAGEAVIAGIAVASKSGAAKPAPGSPLLIRGVDAVGEGTPWTAQTWLNLGDHPFAGLPATFRSLPPELYGAEWIQTAPRTAADSCTAVFRTREKADVWIGLEDSTDTGADWIKPYADLHKTVQTDGPGARVYRLFSRRVAAGEPVCLRAQGRSSYLVFVLPVTDMEPAYDLKPTLRYEAEKARLSGGARVSDSMYLGKAFVSLGGGGSASIAWPVSIGAADTYALRFRYINGTGRSVPVTIQFVADDGTVLKKEEALFPATTGKWATFDSSTGFNVNAGNYQVVITAREALTWGIDFLEVQ